MAEATSDQACGTRPRFPEKRYPDRSAEKGPARTLQVSRNTNTSLANPPRGAIILH